MPKPRPAMPAMLTLTIALTAGCGETPDERLTELTRQSLHEQAEQNQRLIAQSRQISEAARNLVGSDAEARRELFASHAAMQQVLETQQSRIDKAREEMEHERREFAGQRGRDPIIAQTIGAVGTMLACLLPLGVVIYLLHTLNRNAGNNDDQHLNEFLLEELTSDKPLLLPGGPRTTTLEHSSTADDSVSDDTSSERGDE